MDERYDGEIPNDRRFTPDIAIKMALTKGMRGPSGQLLPFKGVGLVIDLSKARR
jgi:hypothetical protein